MRLRHSRRFGVAAAAAASGLALALLPVSPAAAITIPDWPTSRVPVGCTALTPADGPGGLTLTYTDGVKPVVSGWTYNNSTSRLIQKPGTNPAVLRVQVSQTCGGVAVVAAFARSYLDGVLSASVTPFTVAPLTTDVFTGAWGSGDSTTAVSTGWIEVPFVGAIERYDSFELDTSFHMISNVPYSGVPSYSTGPWSTQRVYVVLATTQTATASKSTVAKGGSVTFTTTLKKASPTTYVALPGVAVKFQTKLPGKPWVTRATKTTTSTGRASYTFKPTATQTWRWVRAENITVLPYTSGSMSAAKTIKVT